jgi:predicted SAM-dependent methyltransferase
MTVYPTKTGLMIAVPLSGNPLVPEWAFAFHQLHPPMNYNVEYALMKGRPVDEARNLLAKQAIAKNCKYLFFVDEDVTPPAHTVRQLIYHLEHWPKAAIAAGIYCHKSPPSMPMVFRGNGIGPYWDWKVGEVFDCSGVGMGCAMIRVEALKDLEEPWFKCYSSDTEVLTRRGWLKWPDVATDDEFATRMKNGKMVYQKAISLTVESHKGKMVHFAGEGADLLVTPNHRMYGRRVLGWNGKRNEFKQGPLEFIPAEYVAKNYGKSGPGARRFRVPANVQWFGKLPKVGNKIQVQVSYPKHRGLSSKHWVDLKDWVAFIGIYLAEGSCNGTFKRMGVKFHHNKKAQPLYVQSMAAMAAMPLKRTGANQVSISQSKKSKHYREIESLLKKLPWRFRNKGFGDSYFARDSFLYEQVFPLGNKYTKYVPVWVKELPTEYLKILLDWFCKGDGSIRKSGCRVFGTTSKRLANDLQELFLKTGKSASIRTYLPKKDGYIEGRLVKYKNCAPFYFLFERHQDFTTLGKATFEDYDGMVYCATVPNETLYVRRNGVPVWCGNTVDSVEAFLDGIPQGEMWTEDLWFCKLVTDAGWKILADGGILPNHWDAKTGTSYNLPPTAKPLQRTEVAPGTKKIVDLGAGPADQSYKTEEGTVLRVDIREDVNPDYRCDLRKMPFATGEFDIVFSSHTLEHFCRKEIPEVLDEWVRIMKPEGEFRLVLPNIKWAAQHIMNDEIDNDVLNVLYGQQSYDENFHKMGFVPQMVEQLLAERGFKKFVWDFENYHMFVRAWKVPPVELGPAPPIVRVRVDGATAQTDMAPLEVAPLPEEKPLEVVE